MFRSQCTRVNKIGTKPPIDVADKSPPGRVSNLQSLAPAARILGGYASGFELLEGRHDDAVDRFVAIYVRGTPRLLLPTEKPLMRAAVSHFLGNRRFAGMLPGVLRATSWLSGSLSTRSIEVSLISRETTPSPLRRLIADALGRDDFQMALRLSYGRPNAKTVAMAVSEAGEPLCFAKFGSESMTNDLVAHESAVLESYEGCDLPVVLPRRLFSGTWAGGHNALITAPLSFRPLGSDTRLANRAADELCTRLFVTRAKLVDSDYWKGMQAYADQHPERDCGGEPLGNIVAAISRNWGAHEFDFGASHGDWTRANIGTVGDRVAAFDWERATSLAPRGIDVAHFSIFEHSFRMFNKSLDIEHARSSVRTYLTEAGMPPGNAEPLVVLALLQMVTRFTSAGSAGIRASDKKFGSSLRTALQTWSS